MPPVAPPLGTAVTVAAGAAVAIGSELAAQFGDKFLFPPTLLLRLLFFLLGFLLSLL
jgi:hypothetical protein